MQKNRTLIETLTLTHVRNEIHPILNGCTDIQRITEHTDTESLATILCKFACSSVSSKRTVKQDNDSTIRKEWQNNGKRKLKTQNFRALKKKKRKKCNDYKSGKNIKVKFSFNFFYCNFFLYSFKAY